MCDTCGCGHPGDAVTFRKPGESGAHGRDHDHPHDHHRDHDHPHHPPHGAPRTIVIERDILRRNDLTAARNRGWFEAKGILALNLVSSPGSGKTTLLERTVTALRDEMPIVVIEGDQQTLTDAERIAAAGAPVLQVNTGHGCHLDSEMIRRAADELAPADGALLLIENVGNLVCPALFDLGEAAKVVIISTTVGDDKPLKYPTMFAVSDLCVINKTDLLPYVDFDIETCKRAARRVNPDLAFVEVSATTGDGLDGWFAWLRRRRAEPKG
ncbi:hydrogenase nickel incorporation protein HypB [bacterium]|nr:hydrogenase nickel incorporation protein HypB [bacterium]